MTTIRLRQTFKYPEENDQGNSDLDEQEQEELIASLQNQTQSTDTVYIQIFSILPLACIPAYLFFSATAHNPTIPFLSLLAITSLVLSALNMFMTPVGTDGKVKAMGVLTVPGIGDVDSDGPLGRTLPLFNPIICGLLGIAAVGMKRRNGVAEGFWLFCLLPGVILGVVWFAKRSIREVGEGIDELGRMRYDYKGA